MELIAILLASLQLQTAPIDTTLRVPVGTRLDAALDAGTITVQTWNRSDVRVTGSAGTRARLIVNLDGGVLRISTSQQTGIAVADLIVTVPRAMSLTLGRGDVDITVRDSEGEVNASNYRGTIDVTGGRSIVALRSQLGEIKLKGARARVDVQASQESVTLTDVTGDVQVESTSKHVTLVKVDSHNLRATSVGGVIHFTGPLHEDGHYSFATHMGSVFLNIVGPIDATVSVATVSGAFSSPAPFRVTERRRANIFTAVFGEGRAQVELESFVGGLVLRPAPM